MSRMTKWKTLLVSQIRYDSHVTAANAVIQRLHVDDTSLTPLTWVPIQRFTEETLGLASLQQDDDADEFDRRSEGRDSDLESLYTDAEVVDTEEALLDDFVGEIAEDEEGKRTRILSIVVLMNMQSTQPSYMIIPHNRLHLTWSPQ